MEGKLRINVILNGGKVSSILQILAKYLDKDSKFNFNQDELSASISYDYAEPPVEIFEAIASNENCSAKIEIGNEQDFLSDKEESKTQLRTSYENVKDFTNDSASNEVLKIAERADVCEILKDVIYAKTNAVFKNKISDLFGFGKGIRRQVFEDMLDAAMNCPIESFEDVEEYWTRKKKRNRKNNVSYAINRIEKFFEEKGYKIDIVVFLKTIRELSNKKDVMTMTQRNTAFSISERTTPHKKGLEQYESQKIILPLEDLKKIYVFREFITNQLETNQSKEEKIHILLDIFKCDEFTYDIRETFETYIKIALKIKVVNKETLKENIEELSESEKPKVSEETLNQFVVKWFKNKKSVCCGLERFLQLLRREFRHIKL